MDCFDVVFALIEMEENLNAWERGFLHSIERQLSDGADLSLEQRIKLFQVYEERI